MRVRRKLYGLSMAALKHVDTWLFDLDNTLYPADCDLFALVDERMRLYLERLMDLDSAAAHGVQKDYFHRYGTTVAGLMANHDIDPHEFLEFVHDISLDRITPNPLLRAHINALPGRKLVYTNGDAPYAQRVLNALGLHDSFEGIFDILAADMVPKPAASSYAMLCDAHNIDAKSAFFADDMARNLRPAKALGMATLWINNGSEQAEASNDHDHIDHKGPCLTEWLGAYHEQEFA
jgi:putative hydrolase of the HAD superfamily